MTVADDFGFNSQEHNRGLSHITLRMRSYGNSNAWSRVAFDPCRGSHFGRIPMQRFLFELPIKDGK